MENIFNHKIPKDEILKDNNFNEINKNTKTKTISEKPFLFTDLSEVLKKQQYVKEKLEDKISKYVISDINPFFDKELKDALDIMYAFVSEIDTEAKPYYEITNGKMNVNMNAYIDSREYLVNEFGIDPSIIRHNTSKDGFVNIKKIYLKDGYSIDSSGIIKKNDDIIMNPYKDPIISILDFNKKIAVIYPGVFVDITKHADKIAEKIYYENPFIINKTSPSIIQPNISVKELEELTGVDLKDDIIDSATYSDEEEMTYCNWGTINYLWLMFLIIVGGGSAGESPLPLTDGGSVNWDCRGTESGHLIKTGHPWMYTTKKPVGMRKSIIQILCKNFGNVFKANIHIKIKHVCNIRFCIGGWVEYGLFKAQEWFSKELGEMICKTKKSTINQAGNKGVDLDYIKTQQQNSDNSNISAMSGR